MSKLVSFALGLVRRQAFLEGRYLIFLPLGDYFDLFQLFLFFYATGHHKYTGLDFEQFIVLDKTGIEFWPK